MGASGAQSQSRAQGSGGASSFGGLGGAGAGGIGSGGASQQAGPSGLFGASILGNSTNQQQQQSQQQQPSQQSQSGPINPQPAYFNHLLERGKKRSNNDKDAQQLGELPTLQLGLGDIARKVRDLGHGNATGQNARGADSRGLVGRITLTLDYMEFAENFVPGIICWLHLASLPVLRFAISNPSAIGQG